MNRKIALLRHAPFVIGGALIGVIALLVTSLFLGPLNPDAFYLNNIHITEMMVDNRTSLADDDGNYYSWAEITNEGSTAVNLEGLSLTDDPERPDRFVFPETVLQPNQSILIHFTGDNGEARPYYASFGLKQGGDSLYLYSDVGNLLDSLTAEDAQADYAYGVLNGERGWFATPTPNAENGGIIAASLSALQDAVFTGVMINEVSAVSKTDDPTSPTDWVELHNTTDTTIDLTGYRLTDNIKEEGFVFRDTRIPAKGYALLYCDSDLALSDSKYAPFSIGKDGDDLYLFSPDGICCDRFNGGKQRFGITSGRSESTTDPRVFFSEPTPGTENAVACTGYAVTPTIQALGGYCKVGTTVTITVPQGSTVYYSLDGSVPNEKSLVYTEGTVITLNKSTVVRAIALRDGYLPSDVATQTFLTEEAHTIPIISVSTDPSNLFGAKGAWTNYQNETLQPIVHTEYFTANGIKELDFDSVFRIAGGWTRQNVQKGFSLNLRQYAGDTDISYAFFDDTPVSVFDNLLLRPSGSEWNSSKLRDEFCAQALKNTDGQLVQSAQPVALYLNGTYYGLYYLREKRNEDFIAAYTDIPAESVQLAQHPALDDWKTKLDPDLDALITYAKTHNLTNQEHYEYVISQIDAQSLMQYFTYQTFFGNGDCINNIACFRDTRGGKWKWIIFDMDWACTSYYANRNFLIQLKNGAPYATYQNYYYPLMTALLKNEQFLEEFLSTYARLLQTTLDAERLIPILNNLADEIEAEIPRQYERFYAPSVNKWNQQIEYIRHFLQTREETMIKQLKTTFRVSDEQWDQLYAAAVKP